MPDLPLRLPLTPAGWLLFGASCIIATCVIAVLAAVAANFLASRNDAPDAAASASHRQRSPVATATMLAFFVACYEIIHHRLGVVPIPHFGLQVALTAVGLISVLSGTAVNLMGRLHLGANWADHATVYACQTLVTTGIFGLVRHPLYASLMGMFLGAALVYANWAVLLATVLIFIPAMTWRARLEERMLSERFSEYAAYRARVGMFFPRLPTREATRCCGAVDLPEARSDRSRRGLSGRAPDSRGGA